MSRGGEIAFGFVATDTLGAVEATGISKTTIQDAVKAKNLIAHYVGRKPVFRAADLDEWIRSLPTEPVGRDT